MKNYIFKITPLLLLLFILNSCVNDDFLEIEPRGVLIPSLTEDYDKILSGLNELEPCKTTISPEPEILRMGDDVTLLEPFSQTSSLEHLKAFRYEKDIYIPEQVPSNIDCMLKTLYSLNKVINEVLQSTGGSENEKKAILAEAKANRAEIYFRLINTYGKPYNETSAAADLGFPIITTSNVFIDNFTRNSVKEVYDFIIKDLKEAVVDIPSDSPFRKRMSLKATLALLGKVYTFMGRFDEALVTFNDALATTTTFSVQFYDYNVTTLPGGVHDFQFGPFFPYRLEPVLQDNTEYLFVRNRSSFIYLFNQLLVSPKAVALYGPTDHRLTDFMTNAPVFQLPFVINARATTSTGSGMHYFVRGIQLPDIYLLRAECKARTGDLSGAVEDVEFLRKHRMPEADASIPTGLSQTELIDYIVNGERARELVYTGHRWFDMRRLSVDPLFSDRTYTHTIYNADGSVQETINLTSERLTLRLPLYYINANPEMPVND